MGAKQSDWVERGRGVVQRLREKWGTARERAGELIARDRAEARAEARCGWSGSDPQSHS